MEKRDTIISSVFKHIFMKPIVFGFVMAVLVCAVGIASAEPYSATIPLVKGWNSIATPYDADVTQLGTLSNVNAGVQWDGANWVTVLPYAPGIIPATSAIFVHTTGASEVVLVMIPSAETITSDEGYSGFTKVSPPLGATWNFVGVSPRIEDSLWVPGQKTMAGAFYGAEKIISPAANDGTSWQTVKQDTPLTVFKGYWVKFGEGGYIRQFWI